MAELCGIMAEKSTKNLIADCIEKLGDPNPVLSLIGDGVLTKENTADLVKALQKHGANVREVTIRFDRVEDGVVTALLKPLVDNGQLGTLNITRFHPGANDREAIAAVIASDVPLRQLRLTITQMDDDEIKPMVQALAHQPKLRVIDMSLNKLSTDTLDALLPVLAPMHDLTALQLPDMPDLLPETREALSTALDEYTHPNLRNASLALGDGMLQRNRDICKELLEGLPQTPAELANYALENMREVERRLPSKTSISASLRSSSAIRGLPGVRELCV